MALISVVYVLKNIDKKWLLEWLRKETIVTFLTFFDLIGLALETFQYSGKEKAQERRAFNQPNIKVTVDSPSRSSLAGRSGSIRGDKALLTPSGSVKHSSVRLDPMTGTVSESPLKKKIKESNPTIDRRSVNYNIEGDLEIKLVCCFLFLVFFPSSSSSYFLCLLAWQEGALSTEVTLVILDVFDLILSRQNPKAADTPQTVKMFSLLNKFVEVHQSEAAVIQLFATIKAFILKVSYTLFCLFLISFSHQ